MNRDEMIEKAARALAAETYSTPDVWHMHLTENSREFFRDRACAVLDAAGALPPEPEPLPIGTRKRFHGVEAVLSDDMDDEPWVVYRGARVSRLANRHVEGWEVIDDAPEASKTVIDADKLAEVALDVLFESFTSGTRKDVADAIRAALADATVPADRILGPTQLPIDLSLVPRLNLGVWGQWGERVSCDLRILGSAARAELARRGESE